MFKIFVCCNKKTRLKATPLIIFQTRYFDNRYQTLLPRSHITYSMEHPANDMWKIYSQYYSKKHCHFLRMTD